MKHNIEHIRTLLDLYYKGATTPAQEEELGRFFAAAGELPADMEPDRRMFLAMADARIPADLEESISKALDAKMSEGRRRPTTWVHRWVRMVSGVAAAGLIAGVTITALHSPKEPPVASQEEVMEFYADETGSDLTPEQIASHTQKALNLLGRTFNAGTNSLASITKI